MAEGKLFIQKDGGECIPLGEVKEVDLSKMETFVKYESNAPCLNMSSLPVTVTLNLADIDWCALIRAKFGSLRKYTMMARRAAKKAARLKRKEFYLFRCRLRAMVLRRYGVTQTYYNGEWRKFMVVIADDYKWKRILMR